MKFTISHQLDAHALRASFSTQSRIDIPNFLGDGEADILRDHLLDRSDWALVMNAGESVYEIPREGVAQLSQQQHAELEDRVMDAARHGFQYRYESVRVSDNSRERVDRNSLLDHFVEFMSSDEVLSFIGDIIDIDDLRFADGQATAYSHGHFLTSHDDDVSGKNRRAAYVFGLSPTWRTEWGGLLMFHGADGNVEEAFVPAMGALRLFKVPVLHSVSYVAPMAPEPRLSITGWLRSQRPS